MSAQVCAAQEQYFNARLAVDLSTNLFSYIGRWIILLPPHNVPRPAQVTSEYHAINILSADVFPKMRAEVKE